MFVTKLLLFLYRQTDRHTHTHVQQTLHSSMWENSVYGMYTSENNLKYDTKHVTRNIIEQIKNIQNRT